MIDARGWFDWMEREPGPPEKVYSQRNGVRMYLPHSMVGRLAGWYSRLFDMSRMPDGRFTPNAAASVHGSILLNGKAIQHYPVTASCWASGSLIPNTNGVAFENESVYTNGRPDETKPLTPAQVATNVHIIRDLSAYKGWTPRRPRDENDMSATLYEHKECVRFGSLPTACPSDRARVLWERILAPPPPAEEEEMKPYLVQEAGSPFIFIVFGNTYTYLRDFAHSDALGIPRDIKRVRAGTLASIKRIDTLT